MSQSPSRLEQILDTHIQTLTLTLRSSTVSTYRSVARGFLGTGRAFDSGGVQGTHQVR